MSTLKWSSGALYGADGADHMINHWLHMPLLDKP